ncbi:MAG: cofactor-independent phosphoglycerate mutase [Candidatus Lokiarchaeota archaeon]|nr:cofactor-independent phosphoglycerate mutase [Candidatus Lokiarchaeota archaeon]
MKYIILVCDGAADWPIESLGNKTIFEVADTKHMDWIATNGKMGTLRTVPSNMPPGSDVANMCIMGYRPENDLTGRGPLEALSAGLHLDKTDIAFRCNLINITDGIIKDYSSGHISSEESALLIQELEEKFGGNGVNFHSGVQYRHILKLDGKVYSEHVETTPPHDQLDQEYKDHLVRPIDPNDPSAVKTAKKLNELIEKSVNVLLDHPVNKKRFEQGKLKATHVWPWSGGKKPDIKPFKEKYGLDGSVISAVDLIFGIGIAAGLTPVRVEGATGLLDTNFEGKVSAALTELKEKDFIYLHIEACDEMGHAGDVKKKIEALELFDLRVVKPILESEELFNNELVIAILPDHPTPIKIRTHSGEPVPFAIYDPRSSDESKISRKYTEESGKLGELGLIENGEDFMEIFLK